MTGRVWVSLGPAAVEADPREGSSRTAEGAARTADEAGAAEWSARVADWLEGPDSPASDPIDHALAFAAALGALCPFPGHGRTARLWELLATVAAADLGAARALEPHLDALAILDQAGRLDLATAGGAPGRTTAARAATWGVFAAEGGTDPLLATRATTSASAGWTLTGTKPWCSLADRLDRALVSATVRPEAGADTGSEPPGGAPAGQPERRLFAVDLRQPGVEVEPGAWHARGLTEVPSGPVRFDRVAAQPVGDAGWYLSRPGFSWGGIGVAACWFGGSVGVARAVFARAASADRQNPDPLLEMHLGVIDERLGDSRRALVEAAALIDTGAATGDAGRLLAKRVRATVARASEDVLHHAAHALGPAPLALDASHAKRVADLELYLRQHHAERDSASLGRQLAEQEAAPW